MWRTTPFVTRCGSTPFIEAHGIMDMLMSGGMEKTLPGLDRFHMVGQWVEPGGGLPPAGKSGRDILQNFCKQDGRRFVTSFPPPREG